MMGGSHSSPVSSLPHDERCSSPPAREACSELATEIGSSHLSATDFQRTLVGQFYGVDVVESSACFTLSVHHVVKLGCERPNEFEDSL
jgi:hypothetical protein